LRSFSGLLEIWSGGRTADYLPLTNTVFWIENHLFGQDATGYHAVNILLQAANALLVWRLLQRLNIPGAWLAGLIFGIHPIHAESVAWISELKNVLSMFFALLSMLCFLELDEKRVLNSAITYVASLVFFALAILSKTQAVFLPIVLLLCVWWQGEKRAGNMTSLNFRCALIRSGPFFLIALVLGLVTIWFQNRGIGEEEIIIGSFARRLVNAGMAVWCAESFCPCSIDGDLSKWRFDSPARRMAAFDCTSRHPDWSLALARPRDTRRFFCPCLFRRCPPAGAWVRPNGLLAQRHARRGSFPIFCGRFFARLFQRGRGLRVGAAATRN
jgi:hypothetical protein